MGRIWTALLGLAVVGAVVALYHPVLDLALVGDDYQWLQHAHHAVHRPLLLLADLDTFYRPANTWSLALDHLIWGWRPAGFRATNLLLHAASGFLLGLAGRRLGLARGVAAAAALIWVTSVFAFEPAAHVAIRFENLLLCAWLLLILAWPTAGQRWSRGRIGAVAACVLLAAAAKESWVVTPVLIVALELAQRGRPLRRAVLPAAVVGVAVVLYVAVYFTVFPGDKSYFSPTASTLAKVPQQLAAFVYLEPLQHARFHLNPAGGAAFLTVLAAIVLAAQRRLRAGIVGAALLLAPTLPILLVPYLPTRYTAIPYAGFLILTGALASAGLERLPHARRGAALVGGLVLAGVMVAAGVVSVRLELIDLERLAAMHDQLLDEARAALPAFATQPVVVVRVEQVTPLGALAETPAGLPKLLFLRGSDPYGLIDTAALFEFVLARPGVMVEKVSPEAAPPPAAVVEHHYGGFVWVAEAVQDIPAEVARWRRRGRPVKVVQVVPISP